MNIQAITKMLGIDPKIVNQVLNSSKNYSQDMNGLIKAINENGGMAQVDRAMGYLNNPIVGKALQMIGVDKTQINEVYKNLKSMQGQDIPQIRQVNNTTNNNHNDYRSRLNRLK